MIAPAMLVPGLIILGGLAFGVMYVAADDRERACDVNEPCRSSCSEEVDSADETRSTIAPTSQPIPETPHWANAICKSKYAANFRSR